MPLLLPEHLVEAQLLRQENIFVMDSSRGTHQDIRPLEVAIVNLMPTKEITELQLLRMLSNSPLQMTVSLLHTASYQGKNSDATRLQRFYTTFDEIKHRNFDALIITGAPVETLAYDDIDYWNELQEIFEYARDHVYSTLCICWAAQAALYHYYGISHETLDEKLFGIYSYTPQKNSMLLRGFNDQFSIPQSRYTKVPQEPVERLENIEVLAGDEETGVTLACTTDRRLILCFGHWEYHRNTLLEEWERDRNKGLDTPPPLRYFVDDDPALGVNRSWSSSGNLFYTNWLNYCVYQDTPYLLDELTPRKK